MNESYVDPTSKYYIDRMWEEYHKMKEELADTKSKLGQSENYINETLKPELANTKLKLKMAHSAWDELDKSYAERAKLAESLITLRAERDALRTDNAVLSEEIHMQLIELGMKRIGEHMSQYFRADDECDTCDALRKDVEEKIRIENERDEWKMKYEAAVEHNRRLRAYNESLVPLIEAAKELNSSYHDVYAVNRVCKAYQHIEETWEDVRARCS